MLSFSQKKMNFLSKPDEFVRKIVDISCILGSYDIHQFWLTQKNTLKYKKITPRTHFLFICQCSHLGLELEFLSESKCFSRFFSFFSVVGTRFRTQNVHKCHLDKILTRNPKSTRPNTNQNFWTQVHFFNF